MNALDEFDDNPELAFVKTINKRQLATLMDKTTLALLIVTVFALYNSLLWWIVSR